MLRRPFWCWFFQKAKTFDYLPCIPSWDSFAFGNPCFRKYVVLYYAFGWEKTLDLEIPISSPLGAFMATLLCTYKAARCCKREAAFQVLVEDQVDRWPDWTRHLSGLNHLLLAANSATNFIIYCSKVMWEGCGCFFKWFGTPPRVMWYSCFLAFLTSGSDGQKHTF